jgi:DNA-binding NarL/FixJ family response regulator
MKSAAPPRLPWCCATDLDTQACEPGKSVTEALSSRNTAMLPESNKAAMSGRLLLVGHEKSMRARLHAILADLDYSADALSFVCSVAEANALLMKRPFDMALVDTGLPDGNGIELIRALHQRDPALPIVVISAPSAEVEIVGALRAGATGYLLKEREDVEISMSLRSALRGGTPIDPFVAKRILQALVADGPVARKEVTDASPPPPAPCKPLLSAREMEILGCIDKGSTNREIAAMLSLSVLTVESHVKNIHKKLSVKTRTQAIFEARGLGLLR